jgi:prepilin-type N-terminal cleavage/methylation domain-containing protein
MEIMIPINECKSVLLMMRWRRGCGRIGCQFQTGAHSGPQTPKFMKSRSLSGSRGSFRKLGLRGFSLVEILVVVAVLGLLATVVIAHFAGTRTATGEAKLRSDVNMLNRAVSLYVAEGGRLDNVSTAEQVLDRLKTKSTEAVARRHVGAVTGRLIDPRVAVQSLAAPQVASTVPRAVWNGVLQKFVITTQGPGIGSFVLDDSKAGTAATAEARQRSGMLFNRADGWVWEWGTHVTPPPLSPPDITLAGDPGTPAPPGSPPPSGPPPPIPSGNFLPQPVALPPPTILPDGGAFTVPTFPTSISISANTFNVGSVLQYRLDGGAWQLYGSAFSVTPGTRVTARNLSTDPLRFIDSPEDTELYLRLVALFTGSVIPSWSDMAGESTLVKMIDNSRVDDVRATYGTATNEENSPNALAFVRSGFISVPPDTDFLLGKLSYYNGTVKDGTQATAVDLKLNIQLLSPATQAGIASAHLSLWSSQNTESSQESADYIQLDNPQTDFAVRVEGVTYSLRLRFANVRAVEGWTDGTKLFVYEDARGTADLIARFVSSY